MSVPGGGGVKGFLALAAIAEFAIDILFEFLEFALPVGLRSHRRVAEEGDLAVP